MDKGFSKQKKKGGQSNPQEYLAVAPSTAAAGPVKSGDQTIPGKSKTVVKRGKFEFEKRSSGPLENEEELHQRLHQDGSTPRMDQSFFTKLCCPMNRRPATDEHRAPAPDADFCASSLVRLTHGITAYRLIEPSSIADEDAARLPLIVCLHGMYNSSYMWGDCSDLLCDCERGPNCRVLVFDFYGRGRSPWTGVPCTLDVLVVQVKDLLDILGLSDDPVSLIGYDMGGAVAVGFAAKYPDLCQSLCLIAPLGIRYREIEKEDMLKRKYFGEYMIYNRRFGMADASVMDFHDQNVESAHAPQMRKQVSMIQWQIEHTNGYLGAILSGIRYFPLRGMEELFTAIGRAKRPVLVIWGEKDKVCTFPRSISIMERCFPEGYIVGVTDCGHNALGEKFTDVMTEILSFHKIAHEEIDKRNAELLAASLAGAAAGNM